MENTEFKMPDIRTYELTKEQYEQCERMLYMYSNHYRKQAEIEGYYDSFQQEMDMQKEHFAEVKAREEFNLPFLLLMKIELFTQRYYGIAHDIAKRKEVFERTERTVIRIVE